MPSKRRVPVVSDDRVRASCDVASALHASPPPAANSEGSMSLFIVRHRHEPERCPATDPYMGAMLLNYLSRPNVRQLGVNIQGEAVVQGEHTLYMIIESSDEDRVRAFMRPFSEAGTVDVYPASTCVRVVTSGGCAASMPVVDEPVPLSRGSSQARPWCALARRTWLVARSPRARNGTGSATGTTPSRRCRFTSGSVSTRRGRPKPIGEEVDGRHQDGTWSRSVTFSRPPRCARADGQPPATP